MYNFSDNLKKIKKEISKLIKDEKYDQIAGKLDLLDDLSFYEKELIESEKYLDLIFNSVNAGVFLIDPKTHRIVDTNIFALKLINYTREEVIGKECHNFICPAQRGKCPITDLNNQIDNDIKQLITKSGDCKYILKSVRPIETKGKTYLLETFTDINKQVRIEKELKKLNFELETRVKERTVELQTSEEKFRKLTELSPTAICIQTTERFLWANPAWSEISGYPLDEVLNMGPLDIIHPDMQEIAKKRSDARLNKEDVISRYNLKILSKDKKVKWVDIALTVIEFDGQTASLAVSTDITKVVDTQQALKESEAKYKSLIENLRHEYFFYRHNTDGMFEYVSPSIEHILGYKPEDFLVHYTQYLTDNPINKEAVERTELSIQGIQQLPYELEIYDVQKNKHILEVSETPIIDSEGNVISVEGIVRDITSQKKAERLIKRQYKEIKIHNEEIKTINEELNAVNDDLHNRFEDIRKLNEYLKISEDKFRTLVRNIPGVVYRSLYDENWTMLFISEQIESFSGYPASAFINNKERSFASIIHPDDQKRVVEAVNKPNIKNKSFVIEYRIIHANGSVVWVYEKGQYIFKGNSNVVEYIDGVIIDITEKKIIEEKLELERKFSTGLINSAPSIICGISNGGITNYINPTGEQITGYKSEELIGKNWWETFYPGKEYQQVEQLFIDFEKGDVKNYEMTLTTKEGEKRIVSWNSINRFDENDKIIEIIGFGNDITEKKKSELALKESEELYQKLVNNQAEGIIIADNIETFIFANPAADRLFGVSAKSLVGRNVREFLSDEQYEHIRNQTKERNKGISNTYELEITRPDKTERILLVTASPEYNEKKEVIGAFAVFRDITDRKIAEKALFESERKLRKLNAQKDKFFSLLAHDLRSPIGNFLQISELLKLNYEELSKDQIHGFFDNLHGLADRTFKLLENLLMWSRSQLGKIETHIEDIMLFKIVHDVGELYQDNLKHKDINLMNEIPLELRAQTDLNFIQTIFRNLITNAIKFSNSGGSITIKSNIVSDSKSNDEFIQISVKDKGVGMPEDIVETIFDIDTDYSTLGTENEKGTGLGLILCKELVEKNGGKIWVESKEGEGSTFYFTLKR